MAIVAMERIAVLCIILMKLKVIALDIREETHVRIALKGSHTLIQEDLIGNKRDVEAGFSEECAGKVKHVTTSIIASMLMMESVKDTQLETNADIAPTPMNVIGMKWIVNIGMNLEPVRK